MKYVELKIKAKSLAAESSIIRKEELRMRKIARANRVSNKEGSVEQSEFAESKRHSLYTHRTGVVRVESRATHLARAFLKGMEYKRVENTRLTPIHPLLGAAIHRMVNKYGPDEVSVKQLYAWLDAE